MTKPLLPFLQNLQAAIFICEGQLYYQNVEAGTLKAISPQAVAQAFAEGHAGFDSGWIPDGIVRYGSGAKGEWMLKFTPPQKYRLTFDLNAKQQFCDVAMPGLLFFGQGRSFYIWATKEKQFNQKAELFHAPVSNVNGTGLICYGSGQKHAVGAGGFAKMWALFWDMAFNRHHANGKSNQYQNDITKQLITLHKSKARRYPLADLVSTGTTLDRAIERFTRR